MSRPMTPQSRPQRGEIWLVQFDPGVGAEIQKIRPSVVLNVPGVGRLPLAIVVPITAWREHYENCSWMVRIESDSSNGLSKESGADAFQVKSVSERRFVQILGMVADVQLARIATAVSVCVGYQPPSP